MSRQESEMRYFEPSAPQQGGTDDALRLAGPEGLDAREQAEPGGGMGEGGVGLYEPPRTREEAEAALDFIGDFCGDCPIRARCAGEACAIFRAETIAEAILDTPVVAGVPMRENIA